MLWIASNRSVTRCAVRPQDDDRQRRKARLLSNSAKRLEALRCSADAASAIATAAGCGDADGSSSAASSPRSSAAVSSANSALSTPVLQRSDSAAVSSAAVTATPSSAVDSTGTPSRGITKSSSASRRREVPPLPPSPPSSPTPACRGTGDDTSAVQQSEAAPRASHGATTAAADVGGSAAVDAVNRRPADPARASTCDTATSPTPPAAAEVPGGEGDVAAAASTPATTSASTPPQARALSRAGSSFAASQTPLLAPTSLRSLTLSSVATALGDCTPHAGVIGAALVVAAVLGTRHRRATVPLSNTSPSLSCHTPHRRRSCRCRHSA